MINENNYETFFMSYIDNELSAAERAAVEAFVLTYPQYAAELTVFEKTKLAPTNIEMEDKIFLYRFSEMEASLDSDFKASLYKKEAILRKPFFSRNTSSIAISIAALFILFFGLKFMVPSESSSIKSVATTLLKETEIKPATDIVKNEKSNLSLNNTSNALQTVFANNKIQIAKNAATPTENTDNKSIGTVLDASSMGTNNITATNNEKSMDINTIATTTDSYTETTNIQATPLEQINTTPLLPTAYKEIDTDESERVINIGMLEIDGASFRGITRGITSRFSALLKRNKTEKEK